MIDPDDESAWETAIADWIAFPSLRREAEDRIRREFRPISWSAAAQGLLRAAGFDPSQRRLVPTIDEIRRPSEWRFRLTGDSC